MNILFIIEGMGRGGKERQLVELIKNLANRQNFKLCLCILDEKNEFPELSDYLTEMYTVKRGGKINFKLLLQLFKIAKKFKPDVIHTWDPISSFYTIFLKLKRRFRYINNTIRFAQPKSFFSLREKLLFRLIFFFSNIVVANSYAGLRLYAPIRKGVVIYNGFDLERANIKEDIVELKRDFNMHNEKVVGMVANITKLKDYKTFIKAAAIVTEKRDDTIFISVGQGNKLNEAKELVKELKLEKKFLFLGMHENIERIIKTFDVGVLSSLSEGLSNSIMEYMAMAKPVVATDSGGTRELIIDGSNGFLTIPKDYKCMAQKIDLLLDNNELSRQYGLNGLSRISTEFGLERMVNNYIAIYHHNKNGKMKSIR
jgi:glycosyltransferase involved in cell wall biosynthesis